MRARVASSSGRSEIRGVTRYQCESTSAASEPPVTAESASSWTRYGSAIARAAGPAPCRERHRRGRRRRPRRAPTSGRSCRSGGGCPRRSPGWPRRAGRGPARLGEVVRRGDRELRSAAGRDVSVDVPEDADEPCQDGAEHEEPARGVGGLGQQPDHGHRPEAQGPEERPGDVGQALDDLLGGHRRECRSAGGALGRQAVSRRRTHRAPRRPVRRRTGTALRPSSRVRCLAPTVRARGRPHPRAAPRGRRPSARCCGPAGPSR